MDDWMPPILRDSKYFMWPFYWYAYKGKNIKQTMHLKTLKYKWTDEQIAEFYINRDTRFSNSRITDLTQGCIRFIFKELDANKEKSFLDIGCAKGYFLGRAKEEGFETTGCDLMKTPPFDHSPYKTGDVHQLPFEDNAFDVVACTHTLEHVINFDQAVRELKRVARKKIVVVVPCQRSYYYTLDEHIRFFPYRWMLEMEMRMKNFVCEKIDGDLVFIGDLS